VPDAALHAGTLSFHARTRFGTLIGSTTNIIGALVGAQDHSMARGWVEATVATLATGRARADRYVRRALDANRHGSIQFALRGVTVVSVSLGIRDVTSVVLHGVMTIRGVSRRVELPSTITRSASITRVTSRFNLHLPDYGVTRLSGLFGLVRVQPRVEVRVNLWFIDRLMPVSDDALEGQLQE
jgi:polyisoprenoid-binding protein YceI